MLVSTAAIDMTPHCPVKLCGYINDIRLTQRTQIAHAPLYAMALRLVLENSQLLILTMDILSIVENRAEQIKESITQAFPIKKEEYSSMQFIRMLDLADSVQTLWERNMKIMPLTERM